MAATAERLSVINDELPSQLPDVDPSETQEWLDSLDAVVDHAGRTRASALIRSVLRRAQERRVALPSRLGTDYVNTISRAC